MVHVSPRRANLAVSLPCAGRDLLATQAVVDGRNDTRVVSDHLPLIVRFDVVLR